MEYTEEVIKEADSIMEKYLPYTTIQTKYFDKDDIISATNCAIKDRQSVLEELNNYASKVTTNGTIYENYYENRLESLTQQIEYLKSKI